MALADALREAGATSAFLCRALPEAIAEALSKRGHALLHAAWAPEPVTEGDDARITKKVIAGLAHRPRWIVVDHYQLGAAWESELRASTGGIAVIDDQANRPHNCDALIDQNSERSAAQYRPLVPEHCRLMLGPAYAMLRQEFRLARSKASARTSVNRLLVSYGGSDPTGETFKALHALRQVTLKVDVDVVAGGSNHRAGEIEAWCVQDRRFHFKAHLDQPANAMLRADLAIGACGTTSWERCALYLPAITTVVADNQQPIAATLGAAGAADILGPRQGVTAEMIADRVLHFAADPASLTQMSRAAGKLTDGLGASRVAQALVDAEQRVANGMPIGSSHRRGRR